MSYIYTLYIFPEWVLSYIFICFQNEFWVIHICFQNEFWVIHICFQNEFWVIYICFQNEFWVIYIYIYVSRMSFELYIYVSRMSFELYLYVSRMSFNNSSYQNDNKWKILFITWPLSGSYLKGVIETYSYWLNNIENELINVTESCSWL